MGRKKQKISIEINHAEAIALYGLIKDSGLSQEIKAVLNELTKLEGEVSVTMLNKNESAYEDLA